GHRLQGLHPVLALPHDLESVPEPEDPGQPGPDQGLVVHQEDPDHGATVPGALGARGRWSGPVPSGGSSGNEHSTAHPAPSDLARNVPSSREARSRMPMIPSP